VYDVQVRILNQLANGREITESVVQVVEAARQAGIRIFVTRHCVPAQGLMEVFQLRMGMSWQRVKSISCGTRRDSS
jgi:biuret amidohydrolase